MKQQDAQDVDCHTRITEICLCVFDVAQLALSA
jgi:hypothetical protein